MVGKRVKNSDRGLHIFLRESSLTANCVVTLNKCGALSVGKESHLERCMVDKKALMFTNDYRKHAS